MKKLISLMITTAMLFSGIQAFAVSDSDVMQYMNNQSEEYVNLLENNTEFLNTVVADKILPIYNFKDGNLFASYNGLNFASYFYNEALYYIALDKNGAIRMGNIKDKIYDYDMSADFDVYFNTEKLSEILSAKYVNKIIDMKVSNLHLGNLAYFLYINTDKGEFIVLNEDCSDDTLPDKRLNANKAYTTDEFVEYCLSLQKAQNEKYDKGKDKETSTIDSDDNLSVITSSPIPTATPDPNATPKPTATLKPTAKPRPTPSAKPTATPSGEKPKLTVSTAGGEITVSLGGEEVEFPDAKPFVDNANRTQIPIQALAEMLDFTVRWDGSSHAATLSKGETTIIIKIGDNILDKNGENIKMDTAAIIREDRTYIPLRFIGEAFGYEVEWIR